MHAVLTSMVIVRCTFSFPLAFVSLLPRSSAFQHLAAFAILPVLQLDRILLQYTFVQ